MKEKLTLGCTATDKITGFTGTVTGLVSYLTGCNQALIVPKCGDDTGKLPEGHWLDVNRIEVNADAPLIEIEQEEDKGPMQSPPVR